jgi:hypothetical protein
LLRKKEKEVEEEEEEGEEVVSTRLGRKEEGDLLGMVDMSSLSFSL